MRFLVAGSGTAEAELKEQAERLGLMEHGSFVGWTGDDVLHSLYRIADLCVVPSLYEPFGLVALEAMASGCPCIVADTGGLREVVPGGRRVGLRFRARDPRSLARMAEQLLTDDALRDRLVAEAGEHVLRFDWADTARQTAAVYDDAARRPRLVGADHLAGRDRRAGQQRRRGRRCRAPSPTRTGAACSGWRRVGRSGSSNVGSASAITAHSPTTQPAPTSIPASATSTLRAPICAPGADPDRPAARPRSGSPRRAGSRPRAPRAPRARRARARRARSAGVRGPRAARARRSAAARAAARRAGPAAPGRPRPRQLGSENTRSQ